MLNVGDKVFHLYLHHLSDGIVVEPILPDYARVLWPNGRQWNHNPDFLIVQTTQYTPTQIGDKDDDI